ncbi:AraC family transcriptional regulator [Aestuariibacter sp. GS-14]|uniref:AraC family transcriptional regulator n=1 Tax=Alteromonadaceae TaxID=72275 RepID=UPI001128CCE6|nr:AraC family transcriptional regulator [Aestuariibacter sp. GS-14]TPV54793.1 AraC family transcriptional regulator [Aestuariibacter sp. GS-14]
MVLQSLQQSMAATLTRLQADEGDIGTAIPGLLLFRRNQPSDPAFCLVEPSIVLVAQGRKQMVAGGAAYPYDTSTFIVNSVDLPASSQVIEASPDAPCVGLVLKLDFRLLADLVSQVNTPVVDDGAVKGISASLGTMTPKLFSPLTRLVELLEEPDAIDVMAPMLKREIHFRLLQSDKAAMLMHIASFDSQAFRVSKAINWLKQHFNSMVRVETLASMASMSQPTFHLHFRQLTGMSPLQYQKWLRLNEAKRLMMNSQCDASTAAFEVGYESPSQFSREYRRMFGVPPRADLAQVRKNSSLV